MIRQILCGILLCSSPAFCDESVVSVKSIDYDTTGFSSSDGVEAIVLQSRFGNTYLQLKGINKEIDGIVFKVSQSGNWGERIFKTTLFGSRYTLMTMKGQTYKVHDPFKSEWKTVSVDDALSGHDKVSSIVTLHEKQKKDGTLKKIESFNREIRQKILENSLAAESKRIENDCGFKAKVVIDWKTIKDENFSKAPSPGSCFSASQGLRSLCSGEPMPISKKNLSKIKQITCKISDRNKITLKGSDLQFEFNKELVNSQKFASYAIFNSAQ